MNSESLLEEIFELRTFEDIGEEKGKFDRSRYDLLSPLSVFVPIDKSGILYLSPSKTMASQI